MYSEIFHFTMKRVYENEGGYVEDHAGPTNAGIVLRAIQSMGLAFDIDHDGDVDVNDLKAMTQEDKDRYYWGLFVNGKYDCIKDPFLCRKIFDIRVNQGHAQAVLTLQRSIYTLEIDIARDGKMGPKTLQAVNSNQGLLPIFKMGTFGVYQAILARHPEYEKYRKNWEWRAFQ